MCMVPPLRGEDWVQQQRTLWHVLAVDMESVEVMADTLQLEFRNGELLVSQTADVPGDVVDCVCSALTATWRFVKFTLSRWLTVGTSARTVVAAMLTGLPSLVDFIVKDTRSSLYYLKGFARMKDRMAFCVQTAIVSRVPEGVQVELLEDSRVALNYNKLWAAAAEELRWAVDIQQHVWDRLGALYGSNGQALADKCIEASHIAFHFMWRRVLHP